MQLAVGFFQAKRVLPGLVAAYCSGHRNVADPQCAHELEARESAQIVRVPFAERRVLRSLADDRIVHDRFAEVVDDRRDGECATEPIVQTFLPA